MGIQYFKRVFAAALCCDACGGEFTFRVPEGFPESDVGWELVSRARDQGWKVVRYKDRVFAFCPDCAERYLALSVVEQYILERSGQDSLAARSARGPAGEQSPAGLSRMIRNIFRIRKEVDHGEEPEPVVWD
jgi:hypothetical protein